MHLLSITIILFQNFIGIYLQNICNIRVNIIPDDMPIFKQPYELAMNSDSLFIDPDISYTVLCLTYDKVRSINILSLVTDDTNFQRNQNYSDLYFKNSIIVTNSRTNFYNNNNSMIKGNFLLKKKTNCNKSYLYCRFLTHDPNIYCEKTIFFKIKSEKRIQYFYVYIIIVSFLITFNILLMILNKQINFSCKKIVDF
jgi:hypothetical protein